MADASLGRGQLEKLSREELIELLLMALEAQALTTKNMESLTGMLAMANLRIKELDDQNKTQEAELIVLRARG